jgi:hypothetical protein
MTSVVKFITFPLECMVFGVLMEEDKTTRLSLIAHLHKTTVTPSFVTQLPKRKYNEMMKAGKMKSYLC